VSCNARWTIPGFGLGLVTVCGDALHPMTPNLGQGGCSALEDAVVLARVRSNITSLQVARFHPRSKIMKVCNVVK
jgi:2-polyprenyl-6-methoxyphenol hydroxylase-like FAD-dependent oxidoreductase